MSQLVASGFYSFFIVIEVNRHGSISVGILSMLSDTYNNIMSQWL